MNLHDRGGYLLSNLRTYNISLPITIALLLTFFPFTSCVETKVDPVFMGSIHGVILSNIDQPIEGAQITTSPITSSILTDAAGTFTIEGVAEGEYTILTVADGYARKSSKIKVVRNSTAEVSLKLTPSFVLAPLPKSPVPANGAINQALSVSLAWSVDNPTQDSLTFMISMYEANQTVPLLQISNLEDTTLVIQNLKYNTTYYWQVITQSSTGNVASGDIWLFKTIPFPDNRILFTTRKDGNYEIYSADPSGGSLTRITTTTSYEFKPLFSENRNVIAFSSNADVDYNIYTMNKDGTNIQRITTLPIAGYHNQGIGFNWSPDNGKFIYSHYDKLYRIDKDGVNLTTIATSPKDRQFRACDWTAVDNKIVVETVGSVIYDSEIYLMNADGSDTVRLVDNLPGIIESPSFSIDGKEIMYTHDASGFESAAGRQLDAHIYILNVDTHEVIDASENKPKGTNDLQPRFSSDGSKIIFVNASNDGTGTKSVWVMDRNGANRLELFTDGEMPSWQ